MKIILSVDRNWGIGCQGQLLLRIPEDMKFFKQMTVGKVVVMGRGTFESLPGKQPLKDRTNIVLSSKMASRDDGLIICRTLESLLQELKKYKAEDIFVIGGEKVFHHLLPYCREAYITKIDNTFPADRFLLNLDESQDWKLVSQSEWKIYDGTQFCFVKYERI
ncbi:MAG: dihydrofolate reductase [Peptococcaceae bacterium]|jgi:dihydrofolate reductase|nr:dihydrofolate reductase [Peptococcaceae bacterium]